MHCEALQDEGSPRDTAALEGSHTRTLALTKFDILDRGCRLSRPATAAAEERKPMIRTRSGVSGGLDIVIGNHVHVNCDVRESHASASPYIIDWNDGQFCLKHEQSGFCLSIDVIRQPKYYDRQASDGTPMVDIGQMCSADRLCIGITSHCVFWARTDRCRFCTIGTNTPREAHHKSIRAICDTVIAAAEDPILPARHVLLGGGTPIGEDRGALFAAEASRAIKKVCDLPIYVMIVAPAKCDFLDLLQDAGVDEIGMNVEFFTPDALRKYAPGKYCQVGQEHYYKCLAHAVRIFGPINTRSIAIVGLEPAEATVAGVRRLAGMGVMPILSPFRALDGSDLAGAQGFSAQQYLDVFDQCVDVCKTQGLVLGPTCIPCQSNVLAMPMSELYRYY